MNGKWPDYLVEEIRGRTDIVELISEYVLLTKKGNHYVGLCPFHMEKTPSFTVNPDKQLFYCFGCQTGGNVFTFVQKRENLNFTEAVKLLAERTGVSLPRVELSPEEEAKSKHRELLAQINKAAKDFFHDCLLRSPAAAAAREYLARRGIDHDTIEIFQLGFAPDGWSNLTDFLTNRGYKIEDLVAAGVAMAKEHGGAYDRFRNRVIFPIHNVRNQIIGFGGRVLDDSLPKYLNSPETELFNKGQNLYGLNQAHKSIRELGETLVVEGYMDVIAAHSHGFRNAVASLGTALTRDQGKLIMRYASNVLLAYDADGAGINATFRGAEILRGLGCKVRVLTLPEGKDPDEYLRSHDPQEFARLTKDAPGWVPYKLNKIISEHPPTTIEAKVQIVNNIAEDVLKTESLVEREGYIRLIANTLGITEEVVYAEIMRLSSKNQKIQPLSDKFRLYSHTNNGNARAEFANPGNQMAATPANGKASFSRRLKAENLLLKLMLVEPKVIALVEEQLKWSEFSDPINNQVLALIKETWLKGNWNPVNLSAMIEDQSLGSYLAQLSMEETGISDTLRAAADCIKIIKEECLKDKISHLQEQAQGMQNSGDIEGALKLLQEINRLLKRPVLIDR